MQSSNHRRRFKAVFFSALVLTCVPIVPARQPQSQQDPVQVEIKRIYVKLINGEDGKPLKQTRVGLEVSPDYREVSAQTGDDGVATLQIPVNAVIYTHNTKQYVACADEPGGLIHNDFKVSQILTTGIVQPVARPNLCGVAAAAPARSPTPGELDIFVRRWRFLEDSPL